MKKTFVSQALAAMGMTSALMAIATLTASAPAMAQAVADIQPTGKALQLRARGSLVIGGESTAQTPAQLSSIFGTPPTAGGHVTVNQMYVEYMVPARVTGLPVVMLHGATLSGKTYDTTPDGRMGWYEYFVRQGHPVYVPDQVSRGRSGVDLSTYNDVRAGVKPASVLPNVFRISEQLGWTMFRFGPTAGQAFADEQFPTAAAAQLSQQAIPDLNATLPSPNPNAKALAELSSQLKGAVLIGHSETGALPLDAVLSNPSHQARALILVEPGSCQASNWTDAQMATFAKTPILAVFGDHLDIPTGTPGFSWQAAYEDCSRFVARVRAAGGRADMLHLPEAGMKGNSHMLMMDKNNLQVADRLLKWIRVNTGKKGA